MTKNQSYWAVRAVIQTQAMDWKHGFESKESAEAYAKKESANPFNMAGTRFEIQYFG